MVAWPKYPVHVGSGLGPQCYGVKLSCVLFPYSIAGLPFNRVLEIQVVEDFTLRSVIFILRICRNKPSKMGYCTRL